LRQVGTNADFDKLRAMTGFDPRTDLTEVVAGATQDGKGLLAGRGAFQPGRIASLAGTAGSPSENYRGITLLGDPSNAVAFLDGTTVILGTRDHVKAGVDRWIAGARATGELSATAAEVSASSQAWAVASGLSHMTGAKAATPESDMVRNLFSKISMLAGGVTLGDNITIHGRALAANAQDAQALGDVIRLFAMMAEGHSPLPAPVISSGTNSVDFTLTITEQQAEHLFGPVAARRGAR
jgi:hypothetical protein